MVEEIIYKLKGFDTKYFSNNESKCTFNFASSFKKYCQIIMKENDIILIYFNDLNILCR